MLVKEENRMKYLESVRRIVKSGGSLFLFETIVNERNSDISEEDQLLRSTTFVETIRIEGVAITSFGCGFRGSTLDGYQRELIRAGFTGVRGHNAHKVSEAHNFAALTARVP